MHIYNGNPEILARQLNIIQINSSNTNFFTKLDKLYVTIHEQKADLVIILESNMDMSDPAKLQERG